VVNLLLVSFAAAEENWMLTTADFANQRVVLKELTESTVKVAPASGGAEQSIAMDDFLDLARSVPAAAASGKYTLQMTGGDHLSGEPVTLKADAIVWKSETLGEISIPASRLVAITPAGKPLATAPGREDVVTLSNGDTVRGIVATLSADKATVQTASGNSEVPMASVAAISFAATPGGGGSAHGFRVRLDDGSSLVGSGAKVDGDSLVLTLGKNIERKVALAHVAAIEQVNGPVSWLSALPPSEAVYYRFMGSARQPAAYMDRNWGGHGPIEFKGHQYAHGIAVHALSRITWPLDGKHVAFRTRYAIEADSPGMADVTVRIRLDDKVVYEQPHVRANTLSPVIVQGLGSAKTLTLEVDGSSGYAQDALDWIEPALLKHTASAAPATVP
jgi:hypothetical protein